MRFRHPLIPKTLGWIGYLGLSGLMSTLDYMVVYADPTVDPVHPLCSRRYVFLTWHENMLAIATRRGHCGMTVMASLHSDAEIFSQAGRHLGWNVVRGSTTRGALTALRSMMRSRETHLNLTSDGPRGPRRTVAQGAIYLASKLGMPLVCCAYAYDRPFRFNSWDRFAVPRPFSRVRGVIGAPMLLPKRLDRDELEAYRVEVNTQLNQLTLEAEDWAESGESRPGQMPMLHRRPAPQMLRELRHVERPHTLCLGSRRVCRLDKASDTIPPPASSRHAGATAKVVT